MVRMARNNKVPLLLVVSLDPFFVLMSGFLTWSETVVLGTLYSFAAFDIVT